MVILMLPMTKEDIDDIINIEKLSFNTPWSHRAFLNELRNRHQTAYIVARIRGNIVGYVGMWITCGEGHITNIAVLPKYRGKGVGRRLISFLFAIGRSRGVRYYTLEVRKSNKRAQKLYKRLGFTNAGLRKGYYGDNKEDAVIMSRHE